MPYTVVRCKTRYLVLSHSQILGFVPNAFIYLCYLLIFQYEIERSKEGSKYSLRTIEYYPNGFLNVKILKNNHLNHKTLKFFKPKFLTLSVRNTWLFLKLVKQNHGVHPNIMPQFDYISKLLFLKNNGIRFDPRILYIN